LIIREKFIRGFVIQSAVFKIIVFIIPYSDFSFQFFQIPEFVPFVKFLLVLAMASFNFSVLVGFPRINQVMEDVVFLAQKIKSMRPRIHRIGAFEIAGVSISEIAAIVRFDCPDSKRSDAD